MRRGQVEVIGALLLIVIVTLMWLGFWTWFYPRIQGYQQRIKREEIGVRRSLGEYVLVEILYKNDEGYVCAYVTNTGDYEATVVSLYLNDTLVWSGNIHLRVGESAVIVTNVTESGVFHVRVCTLSNCYEAVDYVP